MQYLSMYNSLLKQEQRMKVPYDLVHNTSLSITVGILLWVQLVHQAWLLACCVSSTSSVSA